MENIIQSIYEKIKDYRADEGNTLVCQSPERIRKWIMQFEEDTRLPILTEMDNIFQKRYLSKLGVKNFLKSVVERLTVDLGFQLPSELLLNADILDLQAPAKSQSIMRRLFGDLIAKEFGTNISDCGSLSKKYSIYLDDVLCTGLRLMTDLNEWAKMGFGNGKTNKKAIEDGSTILIGAYVFIHTRNYHKKKAQMEKDFGAKMKDEHKMYGSCWIWNYVKEGQGIEIVFPTEDQQAINVMAYKNEIITRVEEYIKEKNYSPAQDDFFRPTALPTNETLFTSRENRMVVENSFLLKGIEILANGNPHNHNMRALGFALPSTKNFGFGALCFSWRSVPNNAPLVFWYETPNFMPLFKVNRG